MAAPYKILFANGFEDRATADVLLDWNGGNWAGDGGIVTGRNGNGFRLSNGGDSYILKSFPNTADMFMGWAAKLGGAGQSGTIFQLVTDSTTILSAVINISTSITFTFYPNNGAPVTVTTNNTGITPSQYTYIEIGIHLSNNSTGYFFLLINGNLIYTSATNLDFSLKTYCNAVSLHNAGGGWFYIDDVYIAQPVGHNLQLSDFFGDSFIKSLANTADGHVAAWTIGGTTPAATSWQSVNESTPDGDTTDVTSGTDGQQFTLVPATLPTGLGNILAVFPTPVIKKTQPGTAVAKNILYNGTTTHVGASNTPTTSYSAYPEYYEDNPFTSTSWQDADFTGLQYGLQRNDS